MFPSFLESHIPAFIIKLWHMISNGKTDNLISWNKDGTTVIIRNHVKFSSELLPLYYKHNNMASFIRQLNKYGFRKVLTFDNVANDKLEFVHKYFRRNNPDLMLQIKRKLTYTKDEKEQSTSIDSKDITKLLANVNELKSKQENFEEQLRDVKNENDALWREISILRHRYQGQQKLIQKLLQFLLVLAQQTRGMPLKRKLYLMQKDGTSKSKQLITLKDCGAARNIPYLYPSGKKGDAMCNNISSDSNTTEPIQVQKAPEQISTTADFSIDRPGSSEMSEEELSQNSSVYFSVPLQEVSPAIVQVKHDDIFNLWSKAKAPKKPLKRIHSVDVEKLEEEDKEISKLDHTASTPTEIPRVTSPSGSILICSPNERDKDTPSHNNDKTSIALPLPNETELENPMEWDFDLLKDIMQNEGLSLDANMHSILTNDDPLSLCFSDSGGHADDEEVLDNNEMISFTSNLIDSLPGTSRADDFD